MDLHQKKCIPCESGGIPLTEEEAKEIHDILLNHAKDFRDQLAKK